MLKINKKMMILLSCISIQLISYADYSVTTVEPIQPSYYNGYNSQQANVPYYPSQQPVNQCYYPNQY